MTRNRRHMLLGALLFTNGAAGSTLAQQPPSPASSLSTVQARPMAGARIRPSEFPPGVPRVTCNNEQLTISADNATLRSVFSALETCLGLKIDIPATLHDERSFIQLGPGAVREVLQDLLGSTDLDYALQPSDKDPTKISALLLMPHVSDNPGATRASNELITASGAPMTAARRAWMETRDSSGRAAPPVREDTSESRDADSAPSSEAQNSAHDSTGVVVANSGVDSAAAETNAPAPQIAAKADPTATPATTQAAATDSSASSATTPATAPPASQQADPASAANGDPAANAAAAPSSPPADANGQPPEANELQKRITDMQQLFEERKKLNANFGSAPTTSGTPPPADSPQ